MNDQHKDTHEAAGGDNPADEHANDPKDEPKDERSGHRTVAELQHRLAQFAAARDWEQYHTPKNLAAALSVEAAELVEIFQWLTPEQSARVMASSRTAMRVEDEVADVLAYLLQFCHVVGVDPLAALEAKIERNETRFPKPGTGHSME